MATKTVDEVTKMIEESSLTDAVVTMCLICREATPVSMWDPVAICDECRGAILELKRMLKEKKEGRK